MTWTKLGGEYSDEIALAGLNDAAFRTHTEAIGWLYQVEAMNLRIPKNLARRFAGSPDYEAAILDLVLAGFWGDLGDAWVVIHHANTIRQGIAAQAKKRSVERQRLRAKRAKVGTNPDTNTVADVDTNTVANADTNAGSDVGPTQSVCQVVTTEDLKNRTKEVQQPHVRASSSGEASDFAWINRDSR